MGDHGSSVFPDYESGPKANAEMGDHESSVFPDYESGPKASAGTIRAPTEGELEVGNNYAQTGFRATFDRLIWHGGSVYDAWLTAVSAQVGQALLTMPTSYSQMGLKLGIFFHLFYVSLGIWTCYLLARLYVEYRNREEKKGKNFKNHIIQYHEVIRSLVGPRAEFIVLFFNIMTMASVATVQIIACASDAYYLNDKHDKRQYTLLFGALAMFMIFMPSLHNFRVMSFLGVMTTTYTAWYLLISALQHGKMPGVKHSGPRNLTEFFTGTTNILYASGGHAVTIEIMHAMWRPRKYKYVYVLNCLYVLTISMPHSVALYWAFGDFLLIHSNAFGVLPSSIFRSTGLVFMIVHQAVAFSLYIFPLFLMWEKLLGIHTSWFPIRAVARIPVVGLLWFFALLIPFFGPINSVIGAVFMSFSVFIIPSIAYIYVFWTPQARQNAAETMAKYLPRWKGVLVVNISVVIAIATLATGLGTYASVNNIRLQIRSFGFFQKCFQCT